MNDSLSDSLFDSLSDSLIDSLRDSLVDSLSDSLFDALSDALSDSSIDSLSNSLVDSLSDSCVDSWMDSLIGSLSLRLGKKHYNSRVFWPLVLKNTSFFDYFCFRVEFKDFSPLSQKSHFRCRGVAKSKICIPTLGRA